MAEPSAAKRIPKIVAMPLGDSALMAGLLNPAPTIPPKAITGAVAETGAVAVSEKETEGRPADVTATEMAPLVEPSVTFVLAVPSVKVIASGTVKVAPLEGFAAKLTITPGTPAPVLSTIFTTRGAVRPVPVMPASPSPLTILIPTGLTGFGVSFRTRSLIASVT